MMTKTLARRVMGPPVAGFLLIAAYVAVEAMGFRGLASAEADTVSEAAALGYAARALQLIDQGQNVNGPLHVREGIVDDAAHELTPIESAMLGRHAELVRLLERAGATNATSGRAACFNRMRLEGNADVDTTLKTCAAGGPER